MNVPAGRSSDSRGSPARARLAWDATWRRSDLDGIPSYRERHKKRLFTLMLAGIAILAGWIGLHAILTPDIAGLSLRYIGGLVVPHSLAICFLLLRMRPSLAEYVAMYGIAVAYTVLEVLFSASAYDAGPFRDPSDPSPRSAPAVPMSVAMAP